MQLINCVIRWFNRQKVGCLSIKPIFIGDNGRSNIKGKGYLHDPELHIPLIIKSADGLIEINMELGEKIVLQKK